MTDRGVSHHTPVCVPARCVPLLLAPPALSAITRMFIISVHCGARTHLERSQENSPLEGVSDHERAHGWKKKEDLSPGCQAVRCCQVICRAVACRAAVRHCQVPLSDQLSGAVSAVGCCRVRV